MLTRGEGGDELQCLETGGWSSDDSSGWMCSGEQTVSAKGCTRSTQVVANIGLTTYSVNGKASGCDRADDPQTRYCLNSVTPREAASF